ncbi:MAG: alpha/beta hydrolase [Actinomycetia bacterium]|nr:alpha/beta hydrolase [Actinomycetes bacterium]
MRAELVPSVATVAASGPRTVLIVVHGFNASLEDGPNVAVAQELVHAADVIAVELRGHGASRGQSTMGGREILEVEAALGWARALGYARAVTIGFSMGGAIVLRHAGILRGVDAVVSVSAPAFWYYRGTAVTRRLHFAVHNRLSRGVLRHGLGTDVAKPPWSNPWPLSPQEAAGRIGDVPLLVVHGQQDAFFPLEHARVIHRGHQAAQLGQVDVASGTHQSAQSRPRSELWLEEGFGHAEASASPELLRRIGQWASGATA